MAERGAWRGRCRAFIRRAKHKRKPHQNRNERGPKPIKERPVSRLYENDEDWRAKDDDDLEIDNIATHKDDEVESDVDKDAVDKDADE